MLAAAILMAPAGEEIMYPRLSCFAAEHARERSAWPAIVRDLDPLGGAARSSTTDRPFCRFFIIGLF